MKLNLLDIQLSSSACRAFCWLGFLLLLAAICCWTWASLCYPEVPLALFYTALLVGIAGWLLGFLFSSDRDRGFLLWTTVVLHLAAVAGQPILEDDHYRFLWDAHQFATTGTPYGEPPEAYFTDTTLTPEFQQLVGDINYPEIPTIYAPTNQYVFLLAYWIKPAAITPLQAIFALFNLLIVWQLLKHAPVRYVLLYAWSPLVLKEVVFTAHVDGLGAGLLFLAAAGLCSKQRIVGAALLALAVGVKIFAWLLVPFLLFRQKPVVWLTFCLACLVIYLPFILQPGSEFFALKTFAEQWQFNPALFAVVIQWLPPMPARLLMAACFGAFLLYYWLHYCRQLQQSEQRPWPRADLIFGILLLVSPVINPWYLLWVLPFAVCRRHCWPWISSIALMLAYLTWLNLENYLNDPYSLPIWISLLQFSLITISLGIDAKRYHHRRVMAA